MKRGAIAGLVAGIAILTGVSGIAGHCLPYRISLPPQPWPWYCSDPAYDVIVYLAFPVNLLTDDISRAVLLAPLSLAIYAAIGGFIASRKGKSTDPTSSQM